MNNFTSAIKGKVIAGNNKYTSRQEKSAIVIEGNKSNNRCVISSVNRDGIVQVYYNVPVLYTAIDASMASWFPENGEQVMVVEKNKNYVITGPFIERPNVSTEYDYYTSGTNDADGLIQ